MPYQLSGYILLKTRKWLSFIDDKISDQDTDGTYNIKSTDTVRHLVDVVNQKFV